LNAGETQFAEAVDLSNGSQTQGRAEDANLRNARAQHPGSGGTGRTRSYCSRAESRCAARREKGGADTFRVVLGSGCRSRGAVRTFLARVGYCREEQAE